VLIKQTFYSQNYLLLPTEKKKTLPAPKIVLWFPMQHKELNRFGKIRCGDTVYQRVAISLLFGIGIAEVLK